MSAGQPALTRLLGGSVDGFGEQHWAQRALLQTCAARGGDDFADLFSLGAVDELISRRGLRTPFLRMAKNGTTLPESSFTTGGGVGAGVGDQVSDDSVLAHFADGATIVLQGLHRTWGPVADLSQSLAADLGHPVQVNAYVTPQQSQGFSDHYDVHDVFVLQIHGAKRWSIREPVLRAPLRDQPWTEHRAEVERAAQRPPHLDATLRPGDCLYLPRGFIHSAAAVGGVSIHLTIGVHGWTRHHLGEALIDRARGRVKQDETIRASLRLGDADLTDDIAAARESLLTAVRQVPDEEVRRWLAGRSRAAQRPEPLAPLAQLATAEELDADTVVRLREHLMLQTQRGADEQVMVRSRAGRFGMPCAQVGVLDRLVERGQARVADLGADLGADSGADRPPPDTEQTVETVRLLVRHGIAVVVVD
ncbi:MAG: cupin domain-containing protein [Ornithinimicrobium sp.]|uniref:cupin domain-containing protein n=1 Tax=Ornithinimicrobium sp. TaxID=1977084 RepID=UPI003D9BA945